MDDLLILDTDKEKLKSVWKIINNELRKLKLKPNPKSNIYKCSNGFNFLGYKYKVINNKVEINNNKKTYKRINKKLKSLKKDKLKYKRVLASYKGYLKIKEVSFKVKLEEIYENYKIKNENFLIIVKDGLLYKTYGDDAKIMWYIFEYKYSNDEVVFGNNSLDKVIEKLRKINMSFLIVNKEGLLVVSSTKNDVYLTYKELAGDLYLLKEKENVLIIKLKEIIETNNDKVDEIMNYFDKILGEK